MKTGVDLIQDKWKDGKEEISQNQKDGRWPTHLIQLATETLSGLDVVGDQDNLVTRVDQLAQIGAYLAYEMDRLNDLRKAT